MSKLIQEKWRLLMLVFAFVSCITLASCGDDDKDEPDDSNNINKSLLIGEWHITNGSYDYRVVFLSDGTGYDKVYSGSNYNIDETFKWSVKGSNLTIIWEGNDIDSYTILTLTAKDLALRENEDPNNYIYRYTRVNN